MALTKEQIEDLYSRLPVLPPPPNIFELAGGDIGAERLYHAVHQLNRVATDRQSRFRVLGMHEMGTDFVLLAGDSPESTVVHEAVHHAGVRSEPATYAITRVLMARARFNLGLRRRPVTYSQVPVAPAERDGLLRSMRLSLAPGEPRHAELIHYVYVPP
ncbi:MAG: hypothetical protein IVW52_04810 [Acidimicrobiales bacterium]|nr:hypothetical protein [Acidimicrobiales bacterium]